MINHVNIVEINIFILCANLYFSKWNFQRNDWGILKKSWDIENKNKNENLGFERIKRFDKKVG